MNKYIDIALQSWVDYWNYIVYDVMHPGQNFFYFLILLSIVAWLLEIVFPWRKRQQKFRKDFWLDGCYMFFNVFIFTLVLHNALSNIFVELFNDFIGLFGLTNIVAIELSTWPVWLQYVILILLVDLVQWLTHRMLHRVPFLWEFHKLHHSVKEMGFSAHLRFHWMESLVYKTNIFLVLSVFGFGIYEFFYIHVITLFIGHLNHANINWSYGPLKYVFNNPKMHIWHHAKVLPKSYKYGANFGISLSIWDYLFKTNYIPEDGRDLALGFEEDQAFPKQFLKQIIWPINK